MNQEIYLREALKDGKYWHKVPELQKITQFLDLNSKIQVSLLNYCGKNFITPKAEE